MNKKAKSKRSKKNKKSGKIILIVLCMAIALISGGYMLLFTGSSPADGVVLIPRNATEAQVSDTLNKVFGSEYAAKLRTTAKAMGLNLCHEGRYKATKGMSRFMLVWSISHGRQSPLKFTINNKRTRADILGSIAAHFNFSAKELDKALSNRDFLKKYGLTPQNATALFLNDTFEAYWTDTPQEVLERIGKAYTRFWNEERKKKATELGLSPAEVITIASITEEESAKKDEYGRIGRLYINRLKKGMRLQACPTVKFALNDFSIQRINRNMLKVESPYNTYRVEGLPPGPIRTVEPTTIDAILESEPSEDLYMCAKDDFSGYHHFSTNYTEHMQYSHQYSNELNRRGIE